MTRFRLLCFSFLRSLVLQTGLELAVQPGLTLNFQSSCLSSQVLGTQARPIVPSFTSSWGTSSWGKTRGFMHAGQAFYQLGYILCPPLCLVFGGARNWTQGRTHMKWELYHWAVVPAEQGHYKNQPWTRLAPALRTIYTCLFLQILLGFMPTWPFKNWLIISLCVHACLSLCAPRMCRSLWGQKIGLVP